MTIDETTILETLHRYFGFSGFRPLQQKVVEALLAGRDAFVLMPTGGGKSLCYQLPALLAEGTTVVVSPLIALMKDQVDGLVEAGIPAAFINSTLSPTEIDARKWALLKGEIKLLYVAPERLLMGDFLELLSRIDITLFAVDEAHCISEWGHDFRSDYRQLAILRERFPSTPIIALTATANDQVQQDIVRQLRLRQDHLFCRASFNRSNLTYAVRHKSGKLDQLLEIIEPRKGESGIIYCGSRSKAEDLATALQSRGYRALPYHAGMNNERRASNQEEFDRDDAEIICATVAFGMGIDKPNIRYVIHYDLPKNLMSYYQETGRAGRDGLPSDCILLYAPGDKVKIIRFIEERPGRQERMIAMGQLNEMAAFAEATECRRRVLLRHFGEEYPETGCGACDNCLQPEQIETYDATRPAQMFLSCVIRLKESFGAAYVIDVLRGSNAARILSNRHHLLSTYGIGQEISKEEWRSISHALISEGYMLQNPDAFNVLQMTQKGLDALLEKRTILLRRTRKEKPRVGSKVAADLPEANKHLFERLRKLRRTIADRHGVPAYIIFDDKTLLQMASRLPQSRADLMNIHGVGETKAVRYGGEFIEEIRRFRRENESAV
jgi:ATP-dependent DNA helicase RecQ